LNALDERLQAGFQNIPAGFGQSDEAKGLEPSLRGPHREHDLRLFADRVRSEMKDEFDFQLFVERFLQVHEAATHRKLMQFPPYLALVRESNQG